jgi:uncharacterized protein (DUF488 family)
MASAPALWTIGHSNHELDRFLALVRGAAIAYVVDVRSSPYSRYSPQFNREQLERALARNSIGYLFLGTALGGRPDQDEHYDADGHALYAPMAARPEFQQGIARVLHGATRHRLGLLCGCGRPQDCHRRLLVGKVLCERGAELRHVLPDGDVMTERSVDISIDGAQSSLFGDDTQSWRSVQPVSQRGRLSASSVG